VPDLGGMKETKGRKILDRSNIEDTSIIVFNTPALLFPYYEPYPDTVDQAD
jgi:hypothetical protein